MVRQTDESVNNLPEQTIDALIEITHSKQLEQFKKEYRTPEGGVNVCYGIEAYGKRREITGAVRTYKDVGFSSMNGNITVLSSGGAVTVTCCNNDTVLKDTAWFQANRTRPPAWAA